MAGIYKIDHANDAGKIVLHLLTGREMEFAVRDDGGNPEMWIYPKDMEESEIKQICDWYPKCNRCPLDKRCDREFGMEGKMDE